MENQNATTQEKFDFGKHFVGALVNFFLVVIVYVFIMPLNIWISATIRLSKSQEGGMVSAKGSFIILNWFRSLFDAFIFIIYPLGALAAVYSLINQGVIPFIISLIVTYFLPIVYQYVKELLDYVVISVVKLEEIANNTKK
jgi:hypothetical protein